MKFKMAQNSLFAMLLRSPWWVSFAIAGGLAMLAAALLPADYRAAGALSALPFVVIGGIAARRQWHLPSAAEVERTTQAVSSMAWPAFAQRLEDAFRRDGYAVQGLRACEDMNRARAGVAKGRGQGAARSRCLGPRQATQHGPRPLG